MKNLIASLIVLLLSLSNLYSEYKFDEIIYDPGRMRMNDVTVLLDNTAVAVGQYGVIRIITEKGKVSSYVLMNEKKDLFSIARISESRLITVGEKGLVYVSKDRGNNWEKVLTPTNSNLKSVYFLNETTGFACGSNGSVIKTTDGGENWTLVNTNTNNDLSEITATELNCILSAGANGTIIRSIDNGVTWTKLTVPSVVNFQHIKAIGNNKVYVMGDKLTVLVSENSGDNWNSPIVESHYSSLYVKPNITTYYFKNENVGVIKVIDLYACIPRNYEYYTTDGGLSWASVNLYEDMFGSAVPAESICMDFADDDFGILFDASKEMYQMSYNSRIKHKLISSNYGYKFVTLNNNKNQMAAVKDGYPMSMILSENNGQNWHSIPRFDTINIKRSYMDIRGLSIPKNDVLLLSVNDAKDTSWDEGNISYYKTLLDGFILKSNDFGLNWQTILIPNREAAYEIDMYSEDYGTLRIGSKNNYMITKDGGNSWDYIDFPDKSNISYIRNVYCQSPQLHLIVATDIDKKNRVYRIYNDGESWNNQIVLPEKHYYFKYINDSLMFAFGYMRDETTNKYKSLISKSTDIGQTWKEVLNQSNQEDDRLINFSYYDKNNFMVFTSLYFYLTNDGGLTWNKIPLSSLGFDYSDDVTTVVYLNPNELIFGNNEGRLFKLTIDITLDINDFSVNTEDFLISPNPASNFIDINLNNEASLITAGKLQIFDMLGIEVMSVGTGLDLSTQRIDVSHLPSGVYYIRIGDRVEKFVRI